MKYNDFVVCDAPFGNVIARFICFRPDKQTIIIDYENNLHELKESLISIASRETIIDFFDKKTSHYDFFIKKSEGLLITSKLQLEEELEELTKLSKEKEINKNQLESLIVMKQIDISNDKNDKDIEESIRSSDIQVRYSMKLIRELESKIDQLKNEIDYYKERLEKFTKYKKQWEEEKENYLEENKNEN